MNARASGFSLIEILVALTIVGLMMAGALKLTQYIGRAKITKTKVMLRVTQQAIDSFHNDTLSYPMSLSDLIKRPAEEKVAKKWQGPYVEQKEVADIKDAWGNELQYRVNSKGSARPYELYSWGKDGEGSPSEEWIDVSSLD